MHASWAAKAPPTPTAFADRWRSKSPAGAAIGLPTSPQLTSSNDRRSSASLGPNIAAKAATGKKASLPTLTFRVARSGFIIVKRLPPLRLAHRSMNPKTATLVAADDFLSNCFRWRKLNWLGNLDSQLDQHDRVKSTFRAILAVKATVCATTMWFGYVGQSRHIEDLRDFSLAPPGPSVASFRRIAPRRRRPRPAGEASRG